MVVHERPLVAMKVHGRFRLGAIEAGPLLRLIQNDCQYTQDEPNCICGTLPGEVGQWDFDRLYF